MSFEKILVAGCLQDPKILRTVGRSAFLPSHISDKIGRYLLKLAIEIGKEGRVTEEIVLECIQQDMSLDPKVKSVYLKTALDYFKEDISNASFTLSKIQEKVKAKELLRGISDAASALQAGDDPKAILEKTQQHFDQIGRADSNYELFNYFDTFQERRAERLESVREGAKSLKLIENMHPFHEYFPRGLQPQTTTAIGGRTGAGKSLLLANMIRAAISPENGLNVLYIIAENTKIETTGRLDAIMLDRNYEDLYLNTAKDPRGDAFFSSFIEEGGGGLWCVKVEVGKFSVTEIRAMIDECRENGFHPDFLAIDSPDHMTPVAKRTASWEAKGDVYLDIKFLAEAEDLIVMTTLPMKASSKSAERVSAEDAAGSYDISRIVNNMILFTETADDKILSRASLVVAKNRDGYTDDKKIHFRFNVSRRLTPWQDIEKAAMEDNSLRYKLQSAAEVASPGSDTGSGLNSSKFKRHGS